MNAPNVSRSDLKIVVGIIMLVSGGVWGADQYLHRTFAPRSAVTHMEKKVHFLVQVASMRVISEIARLESKEKRTDDEKDRLRTLRRELERVQALNGVKDDDE